MADVSVVIPTRDREALLREAVASIERQRTSLEIEIIVVDDGSRDGTWAWLETQPAITRVHLAESGDPARARNAGLAEASGELVLFLDDDDLLEPDALETLAAPLREDPHAAFAFGDVRYCSGDGVPGAPYLEARWCPDRDALWNLLAGTPLFVGATLVRRRVLHDVGGFDTRRGPAEDYDLWLRIALAGHGIRVLEPVARIRRQATGFSSRHALAGLREGLAALRALEATASLSSQHRRALRRTCCRIEIEASRYLAARRQTRAAHAHALNAIRERPGSPAAWRNWLHVWLPARAARAEQPQRF